MLDNFSIDSSSLLCAALGAVAGAAASSFAGRRITKKKLHEIRTTHGKEVTLLRQRATGFTDTQQLRPVWQWMHLFESNTEKEHEHHVRESLSGNSSPHYNLAYAIDVYLATWPHQNKKYLNRSMQYVYSVMCTSKQRDESGLHQHRGWPGHDASIALDHASNAVSVPSALHESYFWRYVARLLGVLRSEARFMKPEEVFHDRPLEIDTSYRQFYNTTLKFLAEEIFDKWVNAPASNEYVGINLTVPNTRSHWAYISAHLYSALRPYPPESDNEAWRERKEKCRAYFERFNNEFYDSLIVKSDNEQHAWVWNMDHTNIQDTSHGGNVISYIVQDVEYTKLFWDRSVVGSRHPLDRIKGTQIILLILC